MTNEEFQKRLAYLHDTLGMNWREIGNIPEFKCVSFSSLARHYNGQWVRKPDLRIKLGLDPEKTCGLCHVFKQYADRVPKPKKYKRWRDMSKKALLNALEHREEIL